MYRQTYAKFHTNGAGIPEHCAYLLPSESKEELSVEEKKKIRGFLKPLDSYGYKKIECENYLATVSAHRGNLKVTSLRLADVIGPFDDSWRFQKYVTWF